MYVSRYHLQSGIVVLFVSNKATFTDCNLLLLHKFESHKFLLVRPMTFGKSIELNPRVPSE